MTILVTGGTGFIGSAVVRRLLAHNHKIRVLTRPTSDLRNLAGLAVNFVEGDLCDPASLRHAVAGCKVVFHVAADYRFWVPDAAAMLRINLDGTKELFAAALAARVERVIYTSSVGTLGLNPDARPADETTSVNLSQMIGPYKRSKFLAEQAVRDMTSKGLPAVIVNPSMPVGPGDIKPTPTGRTIADAVFGRLPAYVDTGVNIVHVDDVAAGHVLAFEKGRIGERYILGGDNMSLQQMLAVIAEFSGIRAPRTRLPHAVVLPIAYAVEGWARLMGSEPPFTVDEVHMARKRMYFSSAKAERELGYQPRPARMALADAVGWFQSAARARRVTVDDVDAALQPSTSARSQSSRFLQ